MISIEFLTRQDRLTSMTINQLALITQSIEFLALGDIGLVAVIFSAVVLAPRLMGLGMGLFLEYWFLAVFLTFGHVVQCIDVSIRLVIAKQQGIKPATGDETRKENLTILLEKGTGQLTFLLHSRSRASIQTGTKAIGTCSRHLSRFLSCFLGRQTELTAVEIHRNR